jgi:hypothetical protein
MLTSAGACGTASGGTQPASLVAAGGSISYGYNLGPDNAQPSPEAFPT